MGADAAETLAKEGYKIAIMSSSGKGEKLQQIQWHRLYWFKFEFERY